MRYFFFLVFLDEQKVQKNSIYLQLISYKSTSVDAYQSCPFIDEVFSGWFLNHQWSQSIPDCGCCIPLPSGGLKQYCATLLDGLNLLNERLLS